MSKDTYIFAILIFFIAVCLVSVGLLVNTRRVKGVMKPIERNYKPGVFNITGDTQTSVGVPFTLKFGVNSNNQSVNAVALEVIFDPKVLEVLKVDTTQSFCQFYPQNRFNNEQGTLSLQCGSPHPGFKGENTIAIVQFNPRIITQTQVEITEKSMILVSDGKGTNIFAKPLQHTVTILNNY